MNLTTSSANDSISTYWHFAQLAAVTVPGATIVWPGGYDVKGAVSMVLPLNTHGGVPLAKAFSASNPNSDGISKQPIRAGLCKVAGEHKAIHLPTVTASEWR
jgi:hypothetical protein